MKVARQLGKVDVCSFARATGSSHGDGTNVEDAHKQEDSTWQTSNSTLQETKQCTRAKQQHQARASRKGGGGGWVGRLAED
jgi:conjugal transfer/entry exclusion protein